MQRVVARADEYLSSIPPGSVDLILTSPPAYPSPDQEQGRLGKEPTLGSYVDNLARALFLCRRALKAAGFLVLVIEPLPGFNPMVHLGMRLKRQNWRVLATYQWDTGDSRASLVIFLGRGEPARLNRDAMGWGSLHWAIPRPPPDAAYGFYEWPIELVQTIVELTIPRGGRIVDPYAGKAVALSSLGPEYDVTAVDVKPL